MQSHKVRLLLHQQADFWQHYFDDGDRCGVFLPDELYLDIGQQVQCTILFINSDARFILPGNIIAQRHGKRWFSNERIGSWCALERGAARLKALARHVNMVRLSVLPAYKPGTRTQLEMKFPSRAAVISILRPLLRGEPAIFDKKNVDGLYGNLQVKLRVKARLWPMVFEADVALKGTQMLLHFSSKGAERRRIVSLVARYAALERKNLRD